MVSKEVSKRMNKLINKSAYEKVDKPIVEKVAFVSKLNLGKNQKIKQKLNYSQIVVAKYPKRNTFARFFEISLL